MKNFSLPNCKKILININEEDLEDLKSILQENELEYFKITKTILIGYIKGLFPIIEEDIIKYINLRKELNVKTFQYNKTCNKEKSKNESEKSDKNSDSNESSSFLSENDFVEKIFNLFDMLKEYDRDDVEKIYDLLDFLNSESQKLTDIIDSLPLITYKNKNEYFAAYYYYLIVSLLRIFESYKPDKKKENLGEYYLYNDKEKGKKEDTKKLINNNEEIEIQNTIAKIRNILEGKIEIIKNEFLNLYAPYKDFMFNIQKEQLNDISKLIRTNINITKTLNKKLKEMEMKYLKLDNILNNLKGYYNEFFSQLSLVHIEIYFFN